MENCCIFIQTSPKGILKSSFKVYRRGEKPLFKQWLPGLLTHIQYIPRNMHTVFALLCFVVVIHWLIFPYPSGLLHWHCSNLTIAPVPAKQPRWIWINTSFEFIMNDYITTTKQSTTKPCAYFLGYTVWTPLDHNNLGNGLSPNNDNSIELDEIWWKTSSLCFMKMI